MKKSAELFSLYHTCCKFSKEFCRVYLNKRDSYSALVDVGGGRLIGSNRLEKNSDLRLSQKILWILGMTMSQL